MDDLSAEVMVDEILRAGLPPDKIPAAKGGDSMNLAQKTAMISNCRLRHFVLRSLATNKEEACKLYDELIELVDKYPEYFHRLRSIFNLDCQPGWLEREFKVDRELIAGWSTKSEADANPGVAGD